jgi:hypothetical protein
VLLYNCQEGNRKTITGQAGEGGNMKDMGMTDNQYKGMLLDELEDWQEVLELAREAKNEKIIKKAEKQIKKINEKLKF